MPSPELLIARIRGEYREMPGLRLTLAQACRLWQVETATCEVVLQTRVAEDFLIRTTNGFMALPAPQVARPAPFRAAIGPSGANASLVRRRA